MKSYLTLFAALGLCQISLAQGNRNSDVESTKSSAAILMDSIQAGVKIGMSDVEQLGDPVMTYGAYADVALSKNLLFGAGLDYWNKSTGTLAETSVEVSDFIGSVNGKYIFTELASEFRPFVVAGAALHRFAVKESSRADQSQIDQLDSDYKDISGKFGLDIGGGAMYRVQPAMDVVGEVRYRSIMDPGVSLSQLAFTAGLGYLL